MKSPRSVTPALIAFGGFPGAGKTTQAKRLAFDLGIPRLSADALGRIVGASQVLHGLDVNAQWIAYDVVFGLSAEFLQSGVSVVLDLNLGHAFQWQKLDALRQSDPAPIWVPIVLQCPRDVCMERIGKRYAANPDMYAPPDVYMTVPHIVGVWTFLEQFDRSDIYVVNAARPDDEIYADIQQHITNAMRAG
jgi:adenylate kinase family enzyme